MTKDGVVKGKKAGKCIVYAYAQNGLALKVTVTNVGYFRSTLGGTNCQTSNKRDR